MLRSILEMKIKDKIRNLEIKRRTGIRDVGHKVKKLKFDYAGHIARKRKKAQKSY